MKDQSYIITYFHADHDAYGRKLTCSTAQSMNAAETNNQRQVDFQR
jgi:hypothetical protein